jgi:Rod binding domain-containing protein
MSTDALSQTASMAASQGTAPQALRAKASTPAEALKAGKQFEAMFLSQMMKPIFDTLHTDGMFGGGQGEEMFRGLLVDNYAKAMANHGTGIGIAPIVAKTLLAAQEVHPS